MFIEKIEKYPEKCREILKTTLPQLADYYLLRLDDNTWTKNKIPQRSVSTPGKTTGALSLGTKQGEEKRKPTKNTLQGNRRNPTPIRHKFSFEDIDRQITLEKFLQNQKAPGEFLGKGGNGRVAFYNAKKHSDGAPSDTFPYVIKLMNHVSKEEISTLEKIHKEVDSAFVATIFDIVPGPLQCAVKMSAISRYNLRDYFFRQDASLSCKEFFMIAKQLLLGLQALHEAGLVHRDMKPENVTLGTTEVYRKDGKKEVIWLCVIVDLEGACNVHRKKEIILSTTTPYRSFATILLSFSPHIQEDIFSLGMLLTSILQGKCSVTIPNELHRALNRLKTAKKKAYEHIICLAKALLPSQRQNLLVYVDWLQKNAPKKLRHISKRQIFALRSYCKNTENYNQEAWTKGWRLPAATTEKEKKEMKTFLRECLTIDQKKRPVTGNLLRNVGIREYVSDVQGILQ